MKAQMIQDKNQLIVSAEDGTYFNTDITNRAEAEELLEKKLKEVKK